MEVGKEDRCGRRNEEGWDMMVDGSVVLQLGHVCQGSSGCVFR